VHVLSAGRDGVFEETNFGDLSGDQSQVREQIVDATVDASGSDDQLVSATFRLADPRVAISDLPAEVAQGDTLTVSGQTNTNPGDEEIIVELFDADGVSATIGTTDEWDSDGVWSVSLATDDLALGDYSAEVSVKDTSDAGDVSIVGDPRLRPDRRAHRAGRRWLPRAAQTRLEPTRSHAGPVPHFSSFPPP
jgi:hypothetical protein